MTKRGIGIEGVASEIGALGRRKGPVEVAQLVEGLRNRFEASDEEARLAIQRAIKEGAVEEVAGTIAVKRHNTDQSVSQRGNG